MLHMEAKMLHIDEYGAGWPRCRTPKSVISQKHLNTDPLRPWLPGHLSGTGLGAAAVPETGLEGRMCKLHMVLERKMLHIHV